MLALASTRMRGPCKNKLVQCQCAACLRGWLWNVKYINVFIQHGRFHLHSFESSVHQVTRWNGSEDPTPLGFKMKPWLASPAGLANSLDSMHGFRLSIREEAAPLRKQTTFAVLEEAARELQYSWQCNRPHISLNNVVMDC